MAEFLNPQRPLPPPLCQTATFRDNAGEIRIAAPDAARGGVQGVRASLRAIGSQSVAGNASKPLSYLAADTEEETHD